MALGQNITMTPMQQPGNMWTGYKPTMAGIDIYNQNQTDMLNSLLSRAMGGLDPSKMSLEPINQQLMSQFNKQIIPSIASRFAGMGEGALGSSGFQGTLGGAMGDLAERLQANTSRYNMQMAPLYMNMLNMGLQPRQQQMFMPGSSGLLQQLLDTLAMKIFSNPMGQMQQLMSLGQGGFGAGALSNPAMLAML